jgi:hypothetical protein
VASSFVISFEHQQVHVCVHCAGLSNHYFIHIHFVSNREKVSNLAESDICSLMCRLQDRENPFDDIEIAVI